jgi:DNA-binding transcriptional LysR family regulator
MELRQLESFVTLEELGTIAKVGERVHLSPAAVHKQLKVLERELGVCLYMKVGRNLEFTQAAATLLPYAKELLAQRDSAIAAMEELKGLRRGFVRIGAGPTLSSYVLPRFLKQYRRKFPAVDLFVETGNSMSLIDSLGRGSLDLALLVSPQLPEEPTISVEVSWDEEFVLVSNLRNVPRNCSIRDLSKFPFILFRKGSRMGNLLDRYFAETAFRPKVIMTFDNAEAIKAMIRTGLGISMLPFWTVDAELRNGSLSLIRQHEPPLFSKIELASRKSSFVPAAVSAFVEIVRKFKFRSPRRASGRRGTKNWARENKHP